MDFNRNFIGKGNACELGDERNFAYFATGSGFLLDFELEMGAGAYALKTVVFGSRPASQLAPPFFMDQSAVSQKDAGLSSNGCSNGG